jgi:large subunit GTPase 1
VHTHARGAQESGALLTPFERNLEVWRQLWRVLERCDLVVQIVDARNPLFFKCDDLDDYVAELAGPTGCLAPPAADALLLGGGTGGAADAAGGVGRVAKRSLLLLNKADLLPPPLRARWAAYLTARGVSFAFFSALVAGEEVEAAQKQYASSLRAALEQGAADAEAAADAVEAALQRGGLATAPVRAAGAADAAADADAEPAAPPSPPVLIARSFAPDHVFNRDELLAHLLALCPQRHASPSPDAEPLAHRLFRFNIGFVGYPNVGKSSTINALAADKRVSVSATPGKTKHFQTLACPDEPELCICDCPGLVFPALAGSKAQMYCDGVLPIDNVRDHMPAVDELVGRVPRRELERAYALRLALRLDGDDPEPLSAAHELLVAHGLIHSFLNKGGQVDEAKSARTILKDLVSGKLRHWSTPPDGLADHDDLRFGDDAARASADEISETAAGRRTITAERYLRDSRFDAQDGVLGVVGGDLGRGGVGGGALAAGARGGKAARRRQMEAADAARRAAAGALGNRLPNRMVATGPSIE